MSKRFLLLLLGFLLLVGAASAQLPFYEIHGYVTATSESGEPVASREVYFYKDWASGSREVVTAETDATGYYWLNVFDLNYLYDIPITFETEPYYLGIPQTGVDPYGSFGTDETVYLGAGEGYTEEALMIVEGAGPSDALGPMVQLTVYLQGYFNSGDETQILATVSVEARTSATGDVAGATESQIVGTALVQLDSTGSGIATFEGLPTDDYYLVVKHKLDDPAIPPGPNHLAVITENTVTLTNGSPSPVEVHLSDPASPNYYTAYTPAGEDDAMYAVGSFYVMRGGDADGSGMIQAADVSLWYADLNEEGIYKGDYDGNEIVQAADHSIWYSNLNTQSYVPED